jgi:sugar O-acyltransferase (sialic acid O-acetyltransferase NeuD family)
MAPAARKAEPIIIVGGFPEVIELALDCGRRIVGVVDPSSGRGDLGFPVLGDDGDAAAIHWRHRGVPAFVAIDDPAKRARLVALYERAGFSFTSLVHPQAKVSPSASMGVGVLVQYGARLAANVRLEDHVRVNVYANVTHDVHVGRFTTIAPNAVILGRVRIGEGSYIGAHSTILPGLEIGSGSVVGAHANVTRRVAARTVVVGNPARVRRGSRA